MATITLSDRAEALAALQKERDNLMSLFIGTSNRSARLTHELTHKLEKIANQQTQIMNKLIAIGMAETKILGEIK